MTGFIAMYNVAYEGSNLIGFFNSIEDIIEHIKNDDYLSQYWIDSPIKNDQNYLKIENSAASWYIDGRLDIYFSIFQVAHSKE